MSDTNLDNIHYADILHIKLIEPIDFMTSEYTVILTLFGNKRITRVLTPKVIVKLYYYMNKPIPIEFGNYAKDTRTRQKFHKYKLHHEILYPRLFYSRGCNMLVNLSLRRDTQ
jgi:hypothetical protein